MWWRMQMRLLVQRWVGQKSHQTETPSCWSVLCPVQETKNMSTYERWWNTNSYFVIQRFFNVFVHYLFNADYLSLQSKQICGFLLHWSIVRGNLSKTAECHNQNSHQSAVQPCNWPIECTGRYYNYYITKSNKKSSFNNKNSNQHI